MKIRSVSYSSRRRSFTVVTRAREYEFPLSLAVSGDDPDVRVLRVYVDPELGGDGFTAELGDGDELTVHIDHVLHYHQDPETMRRLLMHDLTCAAFDALDSLGLSKRALARRMGTSMSQLLRLLDTTNTTKSVDEMVRLLGVLGLDVGFTVTPRPLPAT